MTIINNIEIFQPSHNLKCLQKSDCFELISFNWSLDLNSVPSNEIWLIYIYIYYSTDVNESEYTNGISYILNKSIVGNRINLSLHQDQNFSLKHRGKIFSAKLSYGDLTTSIPLEIVSVLRI